MRVGGWGTFRRIRGGKFKFEKTDFFVHAVFFTGFPTCTRASQTDAGNLRAVSACISANPNASD